MHPGHRHSRLRWLRRLTSTPLLGRHVRIESTDLDAGGYLRTLLGDAAQTSGSAEPVLNVRLRSAPDDRISVSVGDAPAFTVLMDDAPMRVLAALNRQLCYSPGPFQTVHAAGAMRGSGAVILVGGSGAGKSTLAAGLTRAGWRYLSDEAVGIDEHGNVHPYARPITLRPGSWPAFPEVARRLPDGHPRFATSEWHVPASLLGHVADESSAPSAVVEIHFDEGRPADLRSIGRGKALEYVAFHGCNLDHFGQEGLERLARAVRKSECYRLEFGDLTDAVTVLDQVGVS